MARKKPGSQAGFESFDVVYDDGTQTSNRKMPTGDISQFERDDSIRAFFEAQDREIEERSGRKRGGIATIEPSQAR